MRRLTLTTWSGDAHALDGAGTEWSKKYRVARAKVKELFAHTVS